LSTLAFELDEVRVVRGGTAILDGISLALEAGAIIAIVGASGSGKSHLLRVVNRLTEASGGSIAVLGRPIEAWSPQDLRRRVGWVPQRPVLSAGSAAEIVDTAARLGIVGAAELARRRGPALEVAGIDAALERRALEQLSGGERQRVAIARALVCDPDVLLLDEPTSSLDGDAAARLLERLLAWAEQRGCALAVVTHRLEDVETLGGGLAVIEAGRVVDRDRDAAAIVSDPARHDVVRLLTGRSGRS
jgi:ABC-type methionine transport system ATPase subunit